MTETLLLLVLAMWSTLLELAPWLLLGMAIAGVLHVALPAGFVQRQLGGRGGVAKAVALGVPLPLCSCGVIPAGLGLKRDGASSGATVGFLISTPQTGVDSVLVSASFLGWPFALFKVAAAAVTGLVGGWLADRADAGPSGTVAEATGAKVGAAPGRRGPVTRELFTHSLEILRTIWGWVAIGVIVSAAIEVLVPDTFFTGLADMGSWVPILASLAVSLPLYVCATASVPIAAALVAAGMPGGAALVFLMAGPATNVATIGAILRGLGARALAIYLGTIVIGSVLAGLVFDSLLDAESMVSVHQHGEATWWTISSAVLLIGLMAWFGLDDLRQFIARRSPEGGDGQPEIVLGIGGMTCISCVFKLERELRAIVGVAAVEVTLEPGQVVVRGTADEDRVRAAVDRAGFEAFPVESTQG
jgi:uncharacterized membrane protein YraQ (UPF0718 family)/copper chaperone CopZ